MLSLQAAHRTITSLICALPFLLAPSGTFPFAATACSMNSVLEEQATSGAVIILS
jgi:hypothetical protein